jgi:hypothetical protein
VNVIRSPDDLLALILPSVLGGTIGGIILIVLALKAWWEFLKAAKVRAERLRQTASDFGRNPPGNPLLALITTLFVLVAQVLTVGLCYVGGNYVAWMFDNDRWRRVVNIISNSSWRHPPPLSSVISVLKLDYISGAYVVLPCIVLFRSYGTRSRRRRLDLDGLGYLLAWPAVLLLIAAGVAWGLILVIGAFGLFIAILNGDVHNYLSDMPQTLLPLVIGTVTCLIYFLACQGAVRGSRIVSLMWRQPRQP